VTFHDDDKFREECALIGVWNHEEAANLSYLGLYAQQHRGQEGAGVVSIERGNDGNDARVSIHKGRGLVSDVFNNYEFSQLPGASAIGHCRYTTAGSHSFHNIQPFVANVSTGPVALAHNGNLVNADALKARLMQEGAIFGSTSDSEIFLHLVARASYGAEPLDAVSSSLAEVQGAYSLLLLFKDRLVALRDPRGFRPLAIGTLGNGYVFASETCAFDLLGATYLRDVAPGEVVEIGYDNVLRSSYPLPKVGPSPCIFEYVYFARPDSSVFERSVYPVRKRLGEELAREAPVDADIVVPVPDSGVPSALGYAHTAGIPFEFGLVRNHYVGRTFIEPKQVIRDFGVKIKLNPNRELLNGKRVVIVDDSIVRGTTSRKLVSLVRQAGAREVHLRISAPPTKGSCYYGIDTPDKEELIASKFTVSEIAAYVGVDSLAYLSIEGLYRAVQGEHGTFCDACFSGRYPAGMPHDYPVETEELVPVPYRMG
jgi:amidophosphoribosyltransferase